MKNKVKQALPSPIIICGMHRCGTSLISRILNGLGVFMGSDLEENHESISISALNDELLKYTHSYWDQIDGAFSFFDNKEACRQLSQVLENTISTKPFFKPYLGKQKIKDIKYWGWKDPRNTITFPLWLSAFPNAKILFIYRNGIDTAASLIAREKKHNFDVTVPAYSTRSANYMGAFSLWNDYNTFFLKHKEKITPKNLLEIKYEDFLIEPEKFLHAISNFIGFTIDNEIIRNLSAKINAERAYPFTKNPKLIEFYNQIKNNPTLVGLGYKDLTNE